MSRSTLQHLIRAERTPEPIDADDALELYDESLKNPRELYTAASTVRDVTRGKIISFSKKVFVSVTTLCRDTCTYCTYKTEPHGEPFMPIDTVDALLKNARRHGCVEALFVGGEHPEERYPEAAKWLDDQGISSTPQYIARCSELAIKHGLFPHTNAGNLTQKELALVSKTNASVGLMLESSSERLTQQMMPHHGAPSKLPSERIRIIENACKMGIPTTSGILVGIGESPKEAIDSLIVIRDIHRRYGHIQEVIIQNFQPKPDTAMFRYSAADPKYFATIVSLARLIMPEMNIQAPPNLSPESYPELLSAGINDWGGISPVTLDYVNPEFGWPQISDLARHTQRAGFEFRCRFPTYPEYMNMMPHTLCDMASELDDGDGYVKDSRWESSKN